MAIVRISADLIPSFFPSRVDSGTTTYCHSVERHLFRMFFLRNLTLLRFRCFYDFMIFIRFKNLNNQEGADVQSVFGRFGVFCFELILIIKEIRTVRPYEVYCQNSAMLSIILRSASRELKSSKYLQQRFFILRPKTSEKTFKRKDKVDDAFSIIYKAPMENYIIASSFTTTVSALAAIAYGIHRYIHRFEEVSTEQKEYDLIGGQATVSEAEFAYFTIGLVAICLSIRMILYKYPLRIYRNQGRLVLKLWEICSLKSNAWSNIIGFQYSLKIFQHPFNSNFYSSYISVFEGHLPLTKTKLNFQKGDVKQLPQKGILPWKEHRFMIKDRSTILYYEYFRTPAELTNMQIAPKKAK